MTKEALKQANRIQKALEEVTRTKHDIMVYHNERMELYVTVKKGLMNYSPNENDTKHYTLRSDSPLFVAIAAAIEGMREELQDQLDNLDGNMKAKSCMQETYEDYHPIAKTSWWQKAFRWAKPK